MSKFIAVWIAFLIFIGSVAKGLKADAWESLYYEEKVTYIVAYGKPFPELTPFKCLNGDLYKNRSVVRSYTGKAVECKFQIMTRREYEDLNNVSRLF